MPLNREPRIYQGYIISHIGQNAGEKEFMELKNAQACVASGTHSWADDETAISPALQAKINDREAEILRQREADALYFQKMKEEEGKPAKSVEALLASNAGRITVSVVFPIENDTTSKLTYLARPLPHLVAIDVGVLETMQPNVDMNEVGEIVLTFENAKARYSVVSNDGDAILAKLEEADQPEVDIPANWREMSHLQKIPMAKAIRRTSGSMKKVEAEAIIEEWTRTDGQDPEITDGAEKPVHGGAGSEAGNRDTKGFQDEDGNPITAEEKARRDAAKFAAGEDDDGA